MLRFSLKIIDNWPNFDWLWAQFDHTKDIILSVILS